VVFAVTGEQNAYLQYDWVSDLIDGRVCTGHLSDMKLPQPGPTVRAGPGIMATKLPGQVQIAILILRRVETASLD